MVFVLFLLFFYFSKHATLDRNEVNVNLPVSRSSFFCAPVPQRGESRMYHQFSVFKWEGIKRKLSKWRLFGIINFGYRIWLLISFDLSTKSKFYLWKRQNSLEWENWQRSLLGSLISYILPDFLLYFNIWIPKFKFYPWRENNPFEWESRPNCRNRRFWVTDFECCIRFLVWFRFVLPQDSNFILVKRNIDLNW